MKKLVLKTVAITLTAVLGACLILFGSLALCAPAEVANFFSDLGIYGPSIHYFEKQYGKSKSLDDLAVLILKIDAEKDSALAEKYLNQMLNSSDFRDFCSVKDAFNGKWDVTTSEYYGGQYSVSLVRNNKFTESLEYCKTFVTKNGYTAYNPFSVTIAELKALLTSEQLTAIKSEIQPFTTTNDGDIATADIVAIDALIASKN